MEKESESRHATPAAQAGPVPKGLAAVWTACFAVVAVFYLLIPGFGGERHLSPLGWLRTTWNPETDYEHGFLVPVIMIGLVAWQWKALCRAAGKGSFWGLPVALLGAMLFVAAHRTGQPRLAAGGLPMILWGASLFLWGWGVGRLLLFPLFFLWLAIPVPEFQQATTKLQILSTKLAQWGSSLFGVETEVRGTQIHSIGDKWKPLEIDEGCGGIRSLMALVMISSVWAYIADVPLWKKALLCLAALPLAIFGNMLRLTSIFVIANYGDPVFARQTWHDWSGLLLFYPISLALLLAFHSLLEGGLPWKRPRKREIRHVVNKHAEANG